MKAKTQEYTSVIIHTTIKVNKHQTVKITRQLFKDHAVNTSNANELKTNC